MKPIFFALIVSLTLVGCGKETRTVYVNQPAATATVEPTDIENVVKEENDYRLGLGQAALTAGLSCTVQQVASGQWLSNASPGYPGSGVIVVTGTSYPYLMKNSFNQAEASGSLPHSAIPSALQSQFLNKNFKINCTGQFVATETGYYDFELSSDDGSILTVGGTQVINHDGNHGVTAKSGSKYLRRGVHTFTLSYAQTGNSNFALVLKERGSVVNGNVFYH